jgi:hypothetical protein
MGTRPVLAPPLAFTPTVRACFGNGGLKWMEEDWIEGVLGNLGFWEILSYNINSCTPIPFIPLHFTNSQTSHVGAARNRWTVEGVMMAH